MHTFPSNPLQFGRRATRSRALRQAILGSFSHSSEMVSEALAHFTEADWRANLTWLDTSGLALYFLNRVSELHCERKLPSLILDRLIGNLADNRAKNEALLDEALTISRNLTQNAISFCFLKGVTLTPASVVDPSLRVQLDTDLLVCDSDAEKAARVLEAMGYVLHGISGDTWEFKAGGSELPSFDDMYKTKPQRAAELHLAPERGLLERVEWREFGSAMIPALSPEDLYVEQALHLFKHLRSAFTRAAWLLEYRQHMLSRQDDAAFWRRLEERVAGDMKARLALAIASFFVIEIFDDWPPTYLTSLVAHCVSAPMRLWIQRYGRTALLADFPGTKLYLLLENELDSSSTRHRTALLPLVPPPMITLGSRGEGMDTKIKRWWTQLCFILFRLRFHSVEGLRYLLESFRFRRLVAEIQP